MPKRSKITGLPLAVRSWLDAALVKGNFSGYEQLAEALRERGAALGFAADSAISKSSLHRYGAKLEGRLSAIKASTEAAKMIAAAAPDDEDHRSAAVISLIQTEIFDCIVQVQEAGEEVDPIKRVEVLSKAAKNIATLTRASIGQKRHEIDIRNKVRAVADEFGKEAKKSGIVSDEVIETFRSKILGIAA